MDDLDIGTEVMIAMGVKDEHTSSTEEKVGEERLGSSNALSTFGPTLILGSIAVVVLASLIVLAVYIFKRVQLSEKGRQRIKKLKLMVFYNPIIRYLTLNSLKLNMAALMPLKMITDAPAGDILTGIAIFLVINAAAIKFYFVLR